MNIRDKILIVEDERSITNFLRTILTSNDYDVIIARSGAEAYSMITSHCPDLIVLDLGLPDIDGLQIIKSVREWTLLPIVVVSARAHERDKVEALDLGADDYIAKPFRPRELVSRIRNSLRRSGNRSLVRLGSVAVDTDKGVVTKNGAEIALSALEYKILLTFIANRGRMLSRAYLLDEVWDMAGDFVNDNTLTVYIKRLREKIEDDPGNPEIIKTIRGMGYRVD